MSDDSCMAQTSSGLRFTWSSDEAQALPCKQPCLRCGWGTYPTFIQCVYIYWFLLSFQAPLTFQDVPQCSAPPKDGELLGGFASTVGSPPNNRFQHFPLQTILWRGLQNDLRHTLLIPSRPIRLLDCSWLFNPCSAVLTDFAQLPQLFRTWTQERKRRQRRGKQSLSPHATMLTIQQECIMYTNSKQRVLLTGLETQLLVLKGVSSSNKIL